MRVLPLLADKINSAVPSSAMQQSDLRLRVHRGAIALSLRPPSQVHATAGDLINMPPLLTCGRAGRALANPPARDERAGDRRHAPCEGAAQA